MARILEDGRRLRTRVFSELQVPLLVRRPFRTTRQGQRQEQGRRVGELRAAQLHVPIPHATSFAELNAQLLEHRRRRLNDRLRGHAETVGERVVRDQAALLPLPATPYEACEKNILI